MCSEIRQHNERPPLSLTVEIETKRVDDRHRRISKRAVSFLSRAIEAHRPPLMSG